MSPKRKAARSRWGRVFLRGRTYYVKFHWPPGHPAHVRAVGPSEEEAEKTLLAVEAALKNGVPLAEVVTRFFCRPTPSKDAYTEASKVSFAEAKDLYLASALDRKRVGTLASDRPRLGVISEAAWAKLPLNEVTAFEVEEWVNALRKKRGITGPTANRYLAAASAVFKWAGKAGYCGRKSNPIPEIEKFHESSGREVYLTAVELEAWIEGAPEAFRLMARFYARTGVRRDEARLLRWGSVDLDRGVARIVADVAKNHAAREIALTPDLRDALRDHRSRVALREGHMPKSDAHVFEIEGAPWSTYRVRVAFHAAVAGAGDRIAEGKRKALRLHDIRHTVGSILASNGVALKVIARMLGHKHLVTTERYAHILPDAIAQAAKVLSAAIPPPPPDRIAEKAG